MRHLNYLKCCKPHETQTEALNNCGLCVSQCSTRAPGFQLNWKNLNFWEMMDVFEIQITWEEIESKRETVLNYCMWLPGWGEKYHKFKWKLQCITVIKKILRRIKEVWDFGGEIETRTKGHQIKCLKEARHTEKRNMGVSLHWSSRSHFFLLYSTQTHRRDQSACQVVQGCNDCTGVLRDQWGLVPGPRCRHQHPRMLKCLI